MNKIFFESRYISLGTPGSANPEGTSSPEFSYRNDDELQELIAAFSDNEQMSQLRLVHPDLKELEQAVQGCFKGVKAGGGLVFNSRDEFLAIYRNGFWDLPKGKLDKGESFEEAALREVEEECGLKGLELGPELSPTFHTYPLKGRMMLKETRWYRMSYAAPDTPVLQEEEGITDYRWVAPGQASFILESTYASILEVLHCARVI